MSETKCTCQNQNSLSCSYCVNRIQAKINEVRNHFDNDAVRYQTMWHTTPNNAETPTEQVQYSAWDLIGYPSRRDNIYAKQPTDYPLTTDECVKVTPKRGRVWRFFNAIRNIWKGRT